MEVCSRVAFSRAAASPPPEKLTQPPPSPLSFQTAELSATLPGTSPEPLRERIEGVEEVAAPERADAAATNRDRDLALGNWNRTVDLAFGKAIASLSQRGL